MMKQLIPKLRFPEFDNSLSLFKLKDLTLKIGDGLHSTPKYDELGQYYFINGNNLKDGIIFIDEKTKKVNEEEFLKHKKNLSTNTILLSINGTIGNLAFYNNENVILGKSACYINTDENCLKNKYLYYQLKTRRISKYFDDSLTGSTIKNLGLKSINNTDIITPTLQEQTKIADFLGAVDKQLDILNKKKEKLNTYKKGVMQQLFSQQLRFKDDNGNDFPKWEEKTLGEVANIIMGQSPDSNSYNLEGQGLPLIQGNADIVNRISSPRQYTNHITKVSEAGDILFTVRAPVGAVGINNVKSCIGRGVASIRSNENQIFLYQYLLFIENDWEKFSQGSTFTAINSKDLKNYKFFVPKDKEQKKISNFLSAIDKQIESVSAQIQKTESYKKGLLQQMFV